MWSMEYDVDVDVDLDLDCECGLGSGGLVVTGSNAERGMGSYAVLD